MSDWKSATTDELVAALWSAGPVPREAIEETRRRLRSAATRELRLAQGLRVIRDSCSEYPANVARRALEEAGVPDPPDEDHP